LKTVPLFSRKLSRLGICSRSLGTLGSSRSRWTLSKSRKTTRFTPLARLQPGTAAIPPLFGFAAAGVAASALAGRSPTADPAKRRLTTDRGMVPSTVAGSQKQGPAARPSGPETILVASLFRVVNAPLVVGGRRFQPCNGPRISGG